MGQFQARRVSGGGRRREKMTRRIVLMALVLGGCGGVDLQGPKGPAERRSDPSLLAGVAVSEPVTASVASSDSSGFTVASLVAPVVYVSLVPGTATGAMGAMIVNLRTSDTTKVTLTNGGFDPQPIAAAIGDSIQVSAIVRYAGTVDAFFLVAADTPPRIVRTNPPRGQTDVPVNTNIIVVFSEPVAPASINTSSIVLSAGGATIPGAVRVQSTSPFTAEFIPDAPLAGTTTFVLSVSRGVTDVAGQQLDAAASVPFSTGEAPPPTTFVFASISVGSHTCALTIVGKAYCWGQNTYGQVGDGTLTERHVPVAVAGGLTFTAISVGSAHTCALTVAGSAFCWGRNTSGTLGNGTFANSAVPVPVAGGLTFASIRSISATGAASCGVTTAGDAYCWGGNTSGMIGGGAAAACQPQGCSTPVKVAGGLKFATVSVGGSTTCGLSIESVAYCWGVNGAGELGAGTASGPEQCAYSYYNASNVACSTVPVAVTGGVVFSSVSSGVFFSCGLTVSGAAYCWGANNVGQFGNGTATSLPPIPFPTPIPGAGSLLFRTLSAGNQRTCGITLDGQTYCWGYNGAGEAGVPGCNAGGSGCGAISTPSLIPGGHAFVAVSTGAGQVCALTAAGKAYCWGSNVYGALGNGSVTSTFVPVLVGQQ
jgi:alpha-tubulin suppressor-like RCC1 family protein